MKLEFRLLIVDDDPGSIRQAVGALAGYLESKGFSLCRRDATDFSEGALEDLTRLEGREHDLVMVDYNLGRTHTDGAKVAHRLRSGMEYTNIVFYSSNPSHDLHAILAEQQVAGVFIAGRENLDRALEGLARTVIGRAVDLNHMRGIAMAEVAELDVVMGETLRRVFQSVDSRFAAAATRTVKRLRESIRGNEAATDERLADDGLAGVVCDSRLFSSSHKYWAVRRVAKVLSERPVEALRVLQTYEEDIVHNRNMLAHTKEEVTGDGKTVLRSSRPSVGDVLIDEEWMAGYRRKLQRHSAALNAVCDAISREVADIGTGRDSEEG